MITKMLWRVYCEELHSSTNCGFFREKDLAAFFGGNISKDLVWFL